MGPLLVVTLYGTALATLTDEAARSTFGWEPPLAWAVWVVAFALSFVPILRTVLAAACLVAIVPWWAAIPIACLASVLRRTLWRATLPKPTTAHDDQLSMVPVDPRTNLPATTYTIASGNQAELAKAMGRKFDSKRRNG